ncbi:MAG: 5-formyltetrahydrofolate cyclo-ligase [Nanoarchaeota archaeon]|nr:5-formyltetrahydrofolate cyclo-ligase [Nanoarchaeota archaeon]MBU1005218.1 5-formyltetrahydrofolate cyclo-ligase [Nanoarchaeota archaeon]MBU1946889.1 5-formyltetrahydrofolate cyclo-ligase [Nanoarchaeota archaeon]
MKQINRRVILKKRNALSKDEIIKKSSIIKNNLFSSQEYKKSKVIMFYVSFGSEVNTMEMIKEALKEKTVCVPVVEKDRMIASIIDRIDDLNKKNEYKILEPTNIQKIESKEIDLVIVPGVVFDKTAHRIGYGKGYYDKFLKDFKGKKIGLAFNMQIMEIIPKDRWDIGLDKVISEV